MSDDNVRDRIDVRWAVRTRSPIDTSHGPAVAYASFLITLGTYGGDIAIGQMTDNINARGVHDGDVIFVTSPGDAVTLDEASRIMRDRGVAETDIIDMLIAAIVLDDEEIAQSVFPVQH